MQTKDLSHLHAIELRLSNERIRLSQAKTEQERQLRKVWVEQTEKELDAEYRFLGIEKPAEMSLEDIFHEMDHLGL